MTLPLQPKKQAKSPKPQKSAKTEVSVEPAQPIEDNEGIAPIVYITMATTTVVSEKQTKTEIVCTMYDSLNFRTGLLCLVAPEVAMLTSHLCPLS